MERNCNSFVFMPTYAFDYKKSKAFSSFVNKKKSLYMYI